MDGQGVVVAAGLAATWGILVSLIIGIMDARKPMETWQKAAWALGLCFLPFVAWFVWLVASGGLHDFEVALANGRRQGDAVLRRGVRRAQRAEDGAEA
jgi:hypothetical protein